MGNKTCEKQSFNMIQDMTCRHEYDILMRVIPIYDGKNITLSRLAVINQKHSFINHSQEYELATAKSTSITYKMLKD